MVPPDPIKISTSMSETGGIQIRFSRGIEINFDQEKGDKEIRRRQLASDGTYTDEEKK